MRLPLALALVMAASACRPGGGPAVPDPEPRAPACGDGSVDPGEECDDGNLDDADGCLSTCFPPARWARSDPHVHSRGCGGRLDPEGLLGLSAARGIDVTAALVWGDGYQADRRHFTGNDHAASRPDALIHYDLEVSQFAADRTGHLVLLGLYSLDFSSDPSRRPRSAIPVLTWALGQGPRVVAGMAHGQFWPGDGTFPSPPVDCCMPWDFVVEAMRGRLAFIETERLPPGPALDRGTERLWRGVLNAGARVALAGASDFPCIHHELTPQAPRTDVLVEGPITHDAWLDGLRAGRTVLVAGAPDTHLNLRAAGRPLGSEVRISAGEALALSVESVAHEPTSVEILVNGSPAQSVSFPPGAHAAATEIRLGASAWIAASTPLATTSPIYVLVDGAPIRGPAWEICYLRRYVDHLSGLVRSGRLNLGPDRDQALGAYAGVARELELRFTEAGGTECS
jgi:cysteine-rich repeat protein